MIPFYGIVYIVIQKNTLEGFIVNFFKRIVALVLSLALPFSAVLPTYAIGYESNDKSQEESQIAAMTLLNEGIVVEVGDSETFVFEGSDFEQVVFTGSVNASSGDMTINATWDGSYTSTWIVPAWAVTAGTGTVMSYLSTYLAVPAPLAVFLATVVGGLATSNEVKFVSTVNYRWITRYTECYYESSTKVYVNGTYSKTVTKSWTAKDDPNTDSVEPVLEIQ